jgi:NAD(P)-dependent dehydrogenase (short-subunit alcohol dehydrogenase family)
MKKLSDRVAVVTGAAGGIGRATSVALAKEGCHLAICDVNAAGLEETAALVRELGRNVSTHIVDVSSKERMRSFTDEVIAQHGGVNILVNNAGVTVAAPFEQHSLEDFEWIVGINLWGVIYGCKFFLPYLQKAEEAHIVNLSSLFGLLGVPSQTSYCATKFAVHGFSEALWVELRDQGIGVTSVHPGGVRTDIAKSARSTSSAQMNLAINVIERFSVTPEHCAKLIVSAIKKNKMKQMVTRETHMIFAAKRLAPQLPQRVMVGGYRRTKKLSAETAK